MAYNIYDKNGKKIGTAKNEKEAAEDGINALIDSVGCLTILIGGFAALFFCAAWYMAIYKVIEEGNAFYLFWAIPIIAATVIGGRKISLKNIRSFWSVFWRIVLIDISVGTGCGLVAVLIYEGYMDAEALVSAMLLSVVYSLLPAVTVSWVVRRKKKKGK